MATVSEQRPKPDMSWIAATQGVDIKQRTSLYHSLFIVAQNFLLFKGAECGILHLSLGLLKTQYAPVRESADMRDLGAVTTGKVFCFVTGRIQPMVKAGLSCFYKRGSSVSLRLGSSPCKNRG